MEKIVSEVFLEKIGHIGEVTGIECLKPFHFSWAIDPQGGSIPTNPFVGDDPVEGLVARIESTFYSIKNQEDLIKARKEDKNIFFYSLTEEHNFKKIEAPTIAQKESDYKQLLQIDTGGGFFHINEVEAKNISYENAYKRSCASKHSRIAIELLKGAPYESIRSKVLGAETEQDFQELKYTHTLMMEILSLNTKGRNSFFKTNYFNVTSEAVYLTLLDVIELTSHMATSHAAWAFFERLDDVAAGAIITQNHLEKALVFYKNSRHFSGDASFCGYEDIFIALLMHRFKAPNIQNLSKQLKKLGKDFVRDFFSTVLDPAAVLLEGDRRFNWNKLHLQYLVGVIKIAFPSMELKSSLDQKDKSLGVDFLCELAAYQAEKFFSGHTRVCQAVQKRIQKLQPMDNADLELKILLAGLKEYLYKHPHSKKLSPRVDRLIATWISLPEFSDYMGFATSFKERIGNIVTYLQAIEQKLEASLLGDWSVAQLDERGKISELPNSDSESDKSSKKPDASDNRPSL